jgi:hypothetical protein
MDEIVLNTKATPEAGELVEAVVPDTLLREILTHIEDEIAKIRESISDSSRSKARRQRDLNRAEAEICGRSHDAPAGSTTPDRLPTPAGHNQ